MSTDASGVVDDNIANDLFDDVTGAEAGTGDTEYRAIYIKNNHGSLTLQDARIFIQSNTTSADDAVAIAIADEAMNGTVETIANEGTAPSGPSFSSAPVDYATGVQLNGSTGLTPGSTRGVWIRRVVNSSAAAVSGNTFTLRVQGDTLP